MLLFNVIPDWRRSFVLIDALIEVSARIPDIVCIAQIGGLFSFGLISCPILRLVYMSGISILILRPSSPSLPAYYQNNFRKLNANQNAFFDEISEHARLLRPQASQAHVYRKRKINYLFIHISVTAVRIGAWPFILPGVWLHENRWEFECFIRRCMGNKISLIYNAKCFEIFTFFK